MIYLFIELFVSTSNHRVKITATENTEHFFSVSSVLSVADNINIDLYKLPLDLKRIQLFLSPAAGNNASDELNHYYYSETGNNPPTIPI